MATYYEFIIKGDDEPTRAYIEGYFRGKGVERGYLFVEDNPISVQHLKEVVKFGGGVFHVLCTATIKPSLESAIRSAPEELELEIMETHKLRRAYYHFKFKTANRDVAKEIKKIIEELPEDTHVTDYDPQEIIDPSAHGAEGYAPVHEYVFKGKGVIEGDPGGVWQTYGKMVEHDHVHCDDVVVHREG